MYLLGFHLSPLTIISTFFIFCLSLLIKLKYKKKYRFPPGPWPVPILGNLPVFMMEPDVMKAFDQLKAKYGPIYRIKLGILDTIVVSGNELAIEALVKKQVDFADRPNIISFNRLSEGRRNISLGSYDQDWHMRRKLAYRAIRLFLAGPKLDDKVSISVDNVLDTMGKVQEPFDPQDHIDLMLFNIISDICYGTRYEYDDPDFKRMIQVNVDFMELFGNGLISDFIPWAKIFELSTLKKIDKIFQFLIDSTQSLLDNHKKEFDPDNTRDITDCLLLAKHTAEQEGNDEMVNQLTDVHFRQIMLDIIFAGSFTSSMTISWVLLMVLPRPDIQAKIHEEIDSVLGNQRVTSEKKGLFPYCTAVIREAMRISPVAPFGVPRATTCDTTLGGYDIPQGMQVLFNIYNLHHDPKVWKNPSEFNPERFLEEDTGKLAVKSDSFLPFMAGRRVCLGESIAKPEMLLIVISFFQRFNISLPAGEVPPMVGKMTAIGYKAPPFKVLLEERH